MTDPPYIDPRTSPLWQVTREPLLHQFVGYLTDARQRISADPTSEHTLTFARPRIDEVHHAFRTMVRRGEERLHKLSRLLADTLYEGPHDLMSEVVGEVDGERFTLGQPVTPAQLHGLTDLELGVRMLNRVRLDGRVTKLVANRVEYLPNDENPHGVHKILSRIKAEEEVWNKVVDEIFDVDALVKRDKELRHLSRFVKDVFGVKIVVGAATEVHPLHRHLQELSWTREELGRHYIPPGDATVRLQFVETKDYMSAAARKKSGWVAVKSVVSWWDRMFEIQVQPLRSYYREKERLTRESHSAWGDQREALRRELSERVPLLGFTRELLVWLFRQPEGPPPEFEGVRVEVIG